MKKYRLRLTALTPIHIGTGEAYEPTNFVIDNGYLYEFDEIEFFKNLDHRAKTGFINAVNKRGADSLFEIHRIIKQNISAAKKSAHLKVKVTKGIENDYYSKVGRAVQVEGGRRVNKTKVFNRFQIEKIIKDVNTNKPFIPGSSIKGALSTAYQEGCYKTKKYNGWERCFSKPLDNIFKNLLISDTKIINADSIIGYSVNKERFEDDPLGPTNKLEVIKEGAKFEVDIKIRDLQAPESVNFIFLKKWCDNHYFNLFKQSFEPYALFKGKNVDDFTNEYYPDWYYEKYKDFKLKDNQFIIRIGKHSGARAVTIDGMRKIRVKLSGGGPRRKPDRWETLDQETTTWFFSFSEKSNQNLLPFGWILCEII